MIRKETPAMKKVINALGWIVVGCMYFAFGFGMMIAIASSTPMM